MVGSDVPLAPLTAAVDGGGACVMEMTCSRPTRLILLATSPCSRSKIIDLNCWYRGCESKRSPEKWNRGFWPTVGFLPCYARFQ